MIVYHGSKTKIKDTIDFNRCHLGWHAGSLCQAIDLVDPEYRDDKFNWNDVYVYVCNIEPDNNNTLNIQDIFLYDADFIDNIKRHIKATCKVQFPNLKKVYNNIDYCINFYDIRKLLVENGIKYLKYNNKYESKGISYCILDESICIKCYTFYELLNSHLTFIE